MTSGDFHDVPRTSETALTIDLSLVGGTWQMQSLRERRNRRWIWDAAKPGAPEFGRKPEA